MTIPRVLGKHYGCFITSSWPNNLICLSVTSFFKSRDNMCSRRYFYRVPARTGKPGKMERHFPVQGKSRNFEQTGKVGENHTKY